MQWALAWKERYQAREAGARWNLLTDNQGNVARCRLLGGWGRKREGWLDGKRTSGEDDKRGARGGPH